MAIQLYQNTIELARFETLDAEIGSFAAAVAFVTCADPVAGAVARRQLVAARHQLEATAARAAAEVARLHGTPLPDWPARRPHFVAIAATLGSVAQWLFDLGTGHSAGGNAELALGWLGEQAGRIGEDATAAIEEIDRALAELLQRVAAEDAAAGMLAPAARESV